MGMRGSSSDEFVWSPPPRRLSEAIRRPLRRRLQPRRPAHGRQRHWREGRVHSQHALGPTPMQVTARGSLCRGRCMEQWLQQHTSLLVDFTLEGSDAVSRVAVSLVQPGAFARLFRGRQSPLGSVCGKADAGTRMSNAMCHLMPGCTRARVWEGGAAGWLASGCARLPERGRVFRACSDLEEVWRPIFGRDFAMSGLLSAKTLVWEALRRSGQAQLWIGSGSPFSASSSSPMSFRKRE